MQLAENGLAPTPTQVRLAKERRERLERIKNAAKRLEPPRVVLFKEAEPVEPAPVIVPEPAPDPIGKQIRAAWRMLDEASVHHPIEPIIRAACRYFAIPKVEITGSIRTMGPVRARQVAMYLCRKLTGRSTTEIGKKFGGRDHSTVIHAVRRITAAIETDESVRNAVEYLTDEIKASKVDAE